LIVGVVETARRILQHSIAVDCDGALAGLEWNGQLLAASGFAASARNAQ